MNTADSAFLPNSVSIYNRAFPKSKVLHQGNRAVLDEFLGQEYFLGASVVAQEVKQLCEMLSFRVSTSYNPGSLNPWQPTWETQIELLAPSFSLVPPQPL